ncbi:MAG: hypothetical protein Ct9H300mP4_05510 [Gammaproteobacteria bacterium]|nr:MAG: hypothetical protein Ct9H300mP4_05510 [Gammaproteobacteria bacterium]
MIELFILILFTVGSCLAVSLAISAWLIWLIWVILILMAMVFYGF